MKNIAIAFALLFLSIYTRAQGPVKIVNAPGDSIVIDSSRIAVYNSQNNIFLGKDAGRFHALKNSNIAIGILSQGGSNMGGGNVSIGHNSMQKIEGNRNIALGNSSGYNLNSADNNILIGEAAGFNGTNILNNVIIGDQAAYDITGGYGNSIMGKNAGIGLTSGHSNVFIGASSGTYAKSGFQNIYVGKDAGFYNEGNQNVMIGQGSGAVNIHSNFNAYIGMHAGRNIDSADYNVILGPFAGENATMLGDSNVIIGPFAGKNLTGSQQLVIENSDDANPLIYGDFKNDRLTINGQLKVGTFSQYTFPAFSSGKGTFLKLSTDSTSIWAIPSIDDLSDGMNDHNKNLFLGYQRDTLSGSDNIGIGNGALSSLDKNLPNNVQNIGIGTDVLRNLPDGNSNVAIGHWSMLALEDGWSNTAVGDYALGYLKEGTYNTAIGNSNGLLNYGGNGNTFIGYRTGSASTGHTNNYSVHIGYAAGYNDTTDYKLHIGSGWPSKTLIYGDFANDSVRINGVLQINEEFSFPTSDGLNGQVLATDGNGHLTWKNNGGSSSEIIDADGDTYVRVEQGPDDDIIRFNLGSTTDSYFAMTKNNHNIASLFVNSIMNNSNSIFGSSALALNGYYNSIFGVGAGMNLSSGENNLLLGYSAGGSLTTGSSNIMIGSASGIINQSGSFNINIGEDAGYNNVNASGQINIGRRAGYNYKRSNTLNIQNELSNFNNEPPLIWGDFANDSVRINGVFQINEEYAFPIIDGNSGQILQTNGSGQLVWVDKSGIVSELSDADSDTKIEVESSPDADLIEFSVAQPVNPGSHKQLTMDGKTFQAGSPGNSLFIGFNAGLNDSDNGHANTFLGVDSGHNNETGQQNVFVGSGASFSNSFGNRNTSLGVESALQNETGNDNVNLGFSSGYDNVGDENVFIGSISGASHTTGNGNVMLGFGAGENNIAGERNLFLGYQAGRSIQGSNTLIIDNSLTDVPLIHGEFDNKNLSINWDTPTNRPATVNINATLNLKPITNPPACNGDTRGTIYFDDDLDKLRVCTSAGWENMH